MATATAAFIVTDSWNAELYGSLSLSSRLSAAIESGAAFVKIAYFLNRTNSAVGDMVNKIDRNVDDVQRGKKNASAASAAPPDREEIEKTISRLDDLYKLLDGIHSVCHRHRLQNSSLAASGMSKLRRNADRISELADLLRDLIDPTFKEAFSGALQEFENGETVPVSEVCR